MASVTLAAQIPTNGNIYAGYSYLRVNDLEGMHGWTGSLEGRILPHVGLVADISGNYGSESGFVVPGIGDVLETESSAHTILFGPRVSARVERVRPFAHALFGITRWKAKATFEIIEPVARLSFDDTNTSFATAIGGGADFSLTDPIAWRVQADYLRSELLGGARENHFRFSTGLVLNF